MREIKGPQNFFFSKLVRSGLALGLGQVPQVMLRKRDRTIITDDLDRLVVDRRKTGAQGFMSIDEGLKAFLKRRDIHDSRPIAF